MIKQLTNEKIEMARAELANFRAERGSTIACDRGLIWVTQEGEPDDHWLPAGEALVVRRSGRIVIEAAQLSRISVQHAAAPRWRLLSRWFAGHRAPLAAC
jgi:hypothetical protein